MVVALLSWFDERPDWLEHCVASLATLGVDTLVAVDGAYQLFPDARPRSHPNNYIALNRASSHAGIRLVKHIPAATWESEMAKRSFMFQLAEQHTTERDWYFVIDADTVVVHADRIRERLEQTDLDVAAVRMVEPGRDGSQKQFRLPMFFRALRGLRCGHNHYTYLTEDGRKLWGSGKCEPQLPLIESMLCEHRTNLRDVERFERAHAYYRTRDELKVELGTCELCPNPGEVELPTGWQPHPKGLSSVWITVCHGCEPKVREQNRRTIESYGLDPDTIQVTFEKVMV